jgi:hypothetical protein
VKCPKTRRECAAFEQLHDEELPPFVFSHVVNRANVRIVQRGCGVCFAFEALLRIRFGVDIRRQNLDRNVSIETCVSGAVNFAHPAGAYGRFDFIWTQPGARRQVHRAANYKPGTTGRTAPLEIRDELRKLRRLGPEREARPACRPGMSLLHLPALAELLNPRELGVRETR